MSVNLFIKACFDSPSGETRTLTRFFEDVGLSWEGTEAHGVQMVKVLEQAGFHSVEAKPYHAAPRKYLDAYELADHFKDIVQSDARQHFDSLI